MTSDTTGIRVVLRTGDIVAGAQAGSFGNPRGIAVQEEGGLVVTEAHTAPRRLTYGAPAITSITPQTIDSRGGETVTVKGRNFSSETIVVLAGTLISSAQVRDTGTIIFRAPKLPSGKATLTLQNRGGIGQAPIVLKPVPLNALDIGAITTIAGSSTFAGDGGPANQSGLDLPQGVAVDESGNVYIADTNHDRVRKIDRLTGIITTIAGTGQNGYSGDRGPAIAAKLNRPLGPVIASNGDLYILDSLNFSIRKVSAATGIIVTVSGDAGPGFSGDLGPASSGRFFYPRGLAIHGFGNLFIADTGNHSISPIDYPTRIKKTVAGDGNDRFGGDGGPATSASLQFPESIAIDARGNLFIADSGNARIRRVDSQTKMIKTVAGGDGTLDYPVGISVDADGNVIFVDDAPGSHDDRAVVWVLSAVDGRLRELVADSTYAAPELDALSTTVDGAGNVVIADGYNNLVRRFDRVAGTLRTLAGVSGNVGDGGPAFAASLSGPADVKFDLDGNLLIADSGNHRIRRISTADGRITTIAGNGSHGFDGDSGLPSEATLTNPSNVAVDRLGNIFLSDSGNSRVRRVDAGLRGIRTVVGTGDFDYNGDGPGTATALNSPAGLAFDLDGNLLIADRDNNRIRKYDVLSGIVTTIAGSGSSGRLQGGYSGDNGPAASALLNAPEGVAVDRSGNIFIADSLNGAVRRIDAKSRIITTVFSPEYYVSGVAFDSSGNLFVTGISRLWKVRADGQISAIAGGRRRHYGRYSRFTSAPGSPAGFDHR